MATVNGDNILRIEDLWVSFGTYAGEVQAVRGVSFDLRRGENPAIGGESGSGKAVTAKSIMHLLPAADTTIKGGENPFEGADILKTPEKRMQDIRGSKTAMGF